MMKLFEIPTWVSWITKRSLKTILLVFFGGAILMATLIFMFVERIPEKGLAKDFLYTNYIVQEEFGALKSVSDGRSGAGVSYSRGGRKGYYTFSVEGSKKSGKVNVNWHSNASGANFIVDSVELLRSGKRPIVIWPSDQRTE